MSRAELRVGLIGVGQMGGFHLETWEKIPAGRVVAVADPSETMARSRIGRRPIDWHADWRALLERPDVDAVCIAAPSEMHAQIGARRARARASTSSSRSRSPRAWRTGCAWPRPRAASGAS